MMNVEYLINKLSVNNSLTFDELLYLIKNINKKSELNLLYKLACDTRNKHYGNKVFLRGLIEISNYCKNDCYY